MDAQTLKHSIKSARDLMRKDAGLNTDVDRIPQLAWILFLKCFDDFEIKREALQKNYRTTIPEGFRWRDWASDEKKGLTGDDLIQFVNTKLFPTLSQLIGGPEQKHRDVIATIFKELNNRIQSGYILRQIVNLVNKINFVSSDEIHTMARLYEELLIEMRDAAGSNGEFYTPRPVIRFIVEQIKPSLKKSEKVLDPACGTGGFLIESLAYMEKEAKSIADYKKLRTDTLFGIEKKPMPYLLCMMNLLLHEIDSPNIVEDNTLKRPLREIIDKDRYDVIMTNPPFGGEEEAGIAVNLPVGMQTSDTALAFLLFIMESLKQNGRCGIILPNGPLFAGGVASKIKKKLLEEFNLHTIIRMPTSIFAPYTGIATNILFFEKKGKTKEIWYYEMKIRDGLKAYSKTKSIIYEDFTDVIAWSANKKKNKNAWKTNVNDLIDYNLDIANPNQIEESNLLSPQELIQQIYAEQEKIMVLLSEIKNTIEKEIPT